MRVIRNSVFETNSSSMHSIVVLKHDNSDIVNPLENIKLDKDNNIVYSERDLSFNRWPFKILTDFEGKLKFAIASLVGCCYIKGVDYDSDKLELEKSLRLKKIESIVHKFIPDFNSFCFETEYVVYYFRKDTHERFGGKTITEEENGEKKFYGYDKKTDTYIPLEAKAKQRARYGYVETYPDLLERFLKEKNIELEDFLFNNRYVVIIDGDEYNTFDSFNDMKIIDEEEIEEFF